MTAHQRTQLIAAGTTHAVVLAALHRRCFEECWDAGAMARMFGAPGTYGFLACEAGTPVGFILCRLAGGEGEVLGLGVIPSFRQRGIGAKLLRAALAHAEAIGAGRVVLEVAVDNGAARHLYSAAGFRVVGQRRSYYARPHGLRTDALVLAYDLNGSSGLVDSQSVD